MSKPVLLFGIHCHQPVDNFYNVVDNAVDKAYAPFIDVVSKYNFKFSVHFSGWLFEYIKEHKKTLFKNLQRLSDKGNIEFFTGGYYEPILISIPSDDAKKQIEKLNAFIKDNFGVSPKGLWLTERVYDESIIKDIKSVGVEYIVVDDYHFLSAGFDKDLLNGYFTTESQGQPLHIYPINKDLRYMIPFKEANEVVNYLKTFKENDAAVIFDDGEKFGIWPQTYDWVYGKKWLEKFLYSLSGSVESMTFNEHIKKSAPKGLAYLPSCSYYEMGEWSLKSKDYFKLHEMKNYFKDSEHYLRGGIWKNFFIKYEESNRLHKRMLEMSKNRIKNKNENFRENLYKLQCNDVFWHGIFGGLYLSNLRDNAYQYLINCENEIYDNKQEKTVISDNNFDGYKEAKLISQNVIAIFDEKYSGQMVEFDLRKKRFNFQNTLTRREEFYHKIIDNTASNNTQDGINTIHETKNSDIENWRNKIHYDWYIKNSFIDHIVDKNTDINDFENCSFNELGDFANQPFKLINKNKIIFERNGGIYLDKKYSTILRKSFSLNNCILNFDIEINSNYYNELVYLLEFNFHFANIKDVKINSKQASSKLIIDKTKNIKIEDKYTAKNINIELNKEFALLSYPLNTLSQSENGLNYNNQGLTFGTLFEFKGQTEISGKIELASMEGGAS